MVWDVVTRRIEKLILCCPAMANTRSYIMNFTVWILARNIKLEDKHFLQLALHVQSHLEVCTYALLEYQVRQALCPVW